jgi:hypothetical protein
VPEVGSIRDVATYYSGATHSWHAFALARTAIIHVQETAGVPMDMGLTLVEPADLIAATWSPTSGAIRLYLADSTNGRVWLYDEGDPAPTLIATAPPGGLVDLAADVHGAYWTSRAGLVTEYRASDGAVFPLADSTTSGPPWSLCVGPWAGYVAWSDTSMNDIRAVPR